MNGLQWSDNVKILVVWQKLVTLLLLSEVASLMWLLRLHLWTPLMTLLRTLRLLRLEALVLYVTCSSVLGTCLVMMSKVLISRLNFPPCVNWLTEVTIRFLHFSALWTSRCAVLSMGKNWPLLQFGGTTATCPVGMLQHLPSRLIRGGDAVTITLYL